MKRAYGFLFALLFTTAAHAQNSGTVTNHAFALGKGAGVAGYSSLLCASAQLAVGQSAADPICRTVSGDATLSAAGVLAFNAVNANVGVCGDGTHVAQVTLNAKGLVTGCVNTLITGAPPTGAAGGVLAGTFPNPSFGTVPANTTLCNATAGNAAPTNCNAATMRTNIGVTATGADTTYNFRANNLSDVASTATARTNLGLAIGTNVQAWDADLDCIAAISATGIIKRTGAGTCSAGVVAVGDGGTGQTTLTANAFLTGNGTSPVNQVAIIGLVLGNGASAPTAYGGTTCTNQFMSVLSAFGVATCTAFNLTGAQFANQGTTTTILHGNAGGNLSFGAVSLTTDASGTLQAAQEPAHTGDCTNSAGSLALNCTKTGGVAFAASATTDTTNASNISSGTLPVARLGLFPLTNSLGADVNLTNVANFFDGPTIAQGTTGTWFAIGTVELIDTVVGAQMFCKLWDGTTVISSAVVNTPGASQGWSVTMAGYITSPTGSLRVSCKDATAITGKISAAGAGPNTSTISAFRLN